jgi:hypothetical protein
MVERSGCIGNNLYQQRGFHLKPPINKCATETVNIYQWRDSQTNINVLATAGCQQVRIRNTIQAFGVACIIAGVLYYFFTTPAPWKGY